MTRFSSFTDFAEHYAEITSADAYPAAFTAEIATSQLSIHDEPTTADMPDDDEARLYIQQATRDLFTLFKDTCLADLAPKIAWGIVHSFDTVAKQLKYREDDAARELKELVSIYDPSEIYAVEVEEKQRVCQSLQQAMSAIKCMRDHSAKIYEVETGKVWMSIRGSRTSKVLSASQIDARAFLARRELAKAKVIKLGPIVIVSGGAQWRYSLPIRERLDKIKQQFPDFVLVTTGQNSGADAIAAKWASENGVQHVPFKLEKGQTVWQRNRVLAGFEEAVEAIICEGSGIQDNLSQRCREARIPRTIFRAKQFEQAATRKAA